VPSAIHFNEVIAAQDHKLPFITFNANVQIELMPKGSKIPLDISSIWTPFSFLRKQNECTTKLERRNVETRLIASLHLGIIHCFVELPRFCHALKQN
jgi:hypothetical protein